MQSTTFRTVAELSRALAAREVSAVELAQDYLARIEAHKELNCFLDVRPEVTLEQAREADKRIAEGKATRLTGIPIAHKDIFVTRKWASTAASRMLEGYMSPLQWARPMKTLPTVRCSIPGTPMRFREVALAVRPLAWQRVWLRLRRRPTRAVPFANRLPFAA